MTVPSSSSVQGARPVPTDGLAEPVLPDCIFCTKNDHWSVDCPTTVPKHSKASHGSDYGAFLTCAECAGEREPAELLVPVGTRIDDDERASLEAELRQLPPCSVCGWEAGDGHNWEAHTAEVLR